ncbi:MAG: helix-turn-helix domain-containing protein [bacterium]|nr:helix-turn-helix domain-containing protein [bacterium]
MSNIIDKNENNGILKDLERLNLSRKEALVYMTLLRLGEVGSSKIITAASLHGQFVYQALETLEQKGLVQHVTLRGRKKFSAKNPKALLRLVESQKRIADDLSAKLGEKWTSSPEQKFEVFKGKESYVAHEFDLLNEAPEECELLIIGGLGDLFSKIMVKQLRAYEELRLKKKIKIRYLGSEAQKTDLFRNIEERKFFEYRLLPGLFTGMVNTNIWPEAIGFNIFSEPVMSFVVSNSIISGSYRQFFETLWKLSAK